MREKVKHTEGPWKVEEDESGTWIRSNNFEICDIELRMEKSFGLNNAEIEREANARLIAAAPDMYNEIENAIVDIDNVISQNPILKTILPALRARLNKRRQAISKAEAL